MDQTQHNPSTGVPPEGGPIVPALPENKRPPRKIKRRPFKGPRPKIITREAETTERSQMDELELAIDAMGVIFYNTLNSCWLSAADITQTLETCFSTVSEAFEKHEELRISIVNEQLSVNQRKLDADTSRSKAFVSHLISLDINNFVLTRGLTKEEFTALMDLMCESKETIDAEGGFMVAVAKGRYAHVFSHKLVFKQVSEDETVVEKKFSTDAVAERKKAEETVLSFLTQSVEEGKDKKESIAISIHKVAEDLERMADIVVDAVRKRQEDKGLVDKQETSGAVVDCLQRAFDEMMNDPASKTQKGKKNISKVFKQLQKDLLSKLNFQSDSEASKVVTEAVECMNERLKVDTIADEYVKKLQALEKSEKRILRFIKMQGMDLVKDGDLAKKLNEGGLDVSGWHKLLAMSDASGPAGADGSAAAETAVGQLAALLGQMENGAQKAVEAPTGAPAPAVTEDLEQVARHVEALALGTQHKIDDLINVLAADDATVVQMEEKAKKEGHAPKMSRRRLMIILGEVVQELCQPLSAITCSIHMVTAGTLGEITETQTAMLKLAAESAERIQKLTDNLGQIVDLPTTLSPDSGIQNALYE